MRIDKDNWIIFGLSNQSDYATTVSKAVGIKKGEFLVSKFADGEILVKAKQTVRERDVLIVQSTSSPVNDNWMELLIAVDAVKRASAKSINVVIPYFGYSRQDRKSKGREPITCKLMTSFLENAGADKVLLLDIHSVQTQGFFNIPVDTIRVSPPLIEQLTTQCCLDESLVVVASDYGAVKKARDISEQLELDIAIIDKRRPKANTIEICGVLGDVKNKICILIDDMIDTGGTILGAAKILKENGAKKVFILATHGVFSGDALKNIYASLDNGVVDHIYVTDTIPNNNKIFHKGFTTVKIGKFLAKIIDAHIKHESVSEVHQKEWVSLIQKWNKSRK